MSRTREVVIATVLALVAVMAPSSLIGQAPAEKTAEKDDKTQTATKEGRLSELNGLIDKLEDKIDKKSKEQAEFSLTGDKTYKFDQKNKSGDGATGTVTKESSEADSFARQKRSNALKKEIKSLERELAQLKKERSALEKSANANK